MTSRPADRLKSLATRRAEMFTLLAELITDRDISRALDMLRDALDATMSARVGRTDRGQMQYDMIPDWRSRIAAIELLLRYKAVPPPSVREVHMLHGALEPETPLDGAELIQQLQAQGMDLREIVDCYVSQLQQALPGASADLRGPPQAPAGGLELPE